MSRLIFKAIGPGVYLRHQIDVALPPPDAIAIVVESAPGTWTESDSRYLLEPFPNRQTSYRLALSNRSLTDRKVDVEVLALDQAPLAAPPATALSAGRCASGAGPFGTGAVALRAHEHRRPQRREIGAAAISKTGPTSGSGCIAKRR